MRLSILMIGMALLVAACSSDSRPPVNMGPTISPVQDQSVSANTTSGPIMVTVSDDSTALTALGFSAVGDNDLLLPEGSIAIGPAAGGRALTITPAPGVIGIANIVLTVTDAQGVAQSTSFLLTVNRQSVPFAMLLRDVFGDEPNGTPRELDSLQIDLSEAGDDFLDLL